MLGHPEASKGSIKGDAYTEFHGEDRLLTNSTTFKILAGLTLTTVLSLKLFPTTGKVISDVNEPISRFSYLKNNPINYLLAKSSTREETTYATSHHHLMNALVEADDFFIHFHNKPRNNEKPFRLLTESCINKCSSVSVPLGSAVNAEV